VFPRKGLLWPGRQPRRQRALQAPAPKHILSWQGAAQGEPGSRAFRAAGVVTILYLPGAGRRTKPSCKRAYRLTGGGDADVTAAKKTHATGGLPMRRHPLLRCRPAGRSKSSISLPDVPEGPSGARHLGVVADTLNVRISPDPPASGRVPAPRPCAERDYFSQGDCGTPRSASVAADGGQRIEDT